MESQTTNLEELATSQVQTEPPSKISEEPDIGDYADAVKKVFPAVFSRLSSDVIELSQSEDAYSLSDKEIVDQLKERILKAVEEVGSETLTKFNMDAESFLRMVGSKQNELDVFFIGKMTGEEQVDTLLRPFSRK